MKGFTIKNLKEIEDSAGERAPGIEGRFARKHLDSEHLGISYFRYAPGVRSPMAHSHREQEVRAIEAGDDGLEFIAIGSDRPAGGDGIPAATAWIE